MACLGDAGPSCDRYFIIRFVFDVIELSNLILSAVWVAGLMKEGRYSLLLILR